jgi:hypothetical protein
MRMALEVQGTSEAACLLLLRPPPPPPLVRSCCCCLEDVRRERIGSVAS